VPYSVREVMRQLVRMAQEAHRINVWSKRKFRHLDFPIGSHNKEKIHPRVAFHVERVEKVVGANVVAGDFPHIQLYTSPQGIKVVALPKEHFLEIVEQGRFSLHGNLARLLSETGFEVPNNNAWIEAHRRTLEQILRNPHNPQAKRAAHEYLSHLVLGAAAFELLGGKAMIPEELREHLEAYKEALKTYSKEDIKNALLYYLQFLEAAKRLGFHQY